MRHGKKIAKLGRTAPHRKAMLSNMMVSLFINERVTTTQTRAKELKRTAERVLTCAKKGDLHARRQVLRLIADKQVVAKLFDELGPRYKSRNGRLYARDQVGPAARRRGIYEHRRTRGSPRGGRRRGSAGRDCRRRGS